MHLNNFSFFLLKKASFALYQPAPESKPPAHFLREVRFLDRGAHHDKERGIVNVSYFCKSFFSIVATNSAAESSTSIACSAVMTLDF